MYCDTFLQGISRVLNCSKVHVAAAGLATTYFAVRWATADLPPVQRQAMWIAFIAAAAVQIREIINAWTEEDVARVINPSPMAVHLENSAAVSPLVSPAASSNNRSTGMPPRTKLPLIVVGFSLIALLTSAGCQTPPELTAYREGLHQVDEPLYQAHLLLMDDAVKANVRTDADRQVVRQGIGAGRSLYQQSRTTEAAGQALGTTAP